MQISKRVWISVFASVVLLVGLFSFLGGLEVGRSEFAGVGSAMPKYNQINFPFSYLIDKNSTHYFLGNGTTWKWDYIDTNISKVIMYGAKANTTFFVKVGQYAINNLIPINKSKINFIGENWGTQFTIGASGGFNISSASLLRDISFENLWWEGGGTAVRAITSVMPANTRIDHFVFSHNRINGVRGAGAIGLNLSNLENSEISYNTFYRTKTAHIQLSSNAYDAGNIRIEGNEFYLGYDQAGESAVKILTKKYTSPNGSFVGVYSSANHYLYTTYAGYAWNLTTVEGSIYGVNLVDDRLEGGQLLITRPYNNTFDIINTHIQNNQIYSDVSTNYLINFGQYTHYSIVSGNNLDNAAGSKWIFMDNNTSPSTQPNAFINNQIVTGVPLFSFSLYTVVYGNIGVGWFPQFTVKTAGTNNIRNGANLCNWGASNNNIVSKTIYTVQNNDLFFAVSGGTVSNIKIYDPNGTLWTDLGTSTTGFLVPYKYQLNITYSSAPTITFLWVS